MKIFFIVPYPLNESPSQRFRFEQYFQTLTKLGYTYKVQSFLDSHNWRLFFKRGNYVIKIFALITGILRRFFALTKLYQFDLIFIHREATPLGPPIFEWLITKAYNKKVIYDFDDAIWLTDRQSEPLLLKALKWRGKVRSICKWSYRVSCGNLYLLDYATQFNKNVVCMPTTIDLKNQHYQTSIFKSNERNKIHIGWTGSHSTLKYLESMESILQDIEYSFPTVNFLVIADRRPNLRLRNLIYKPWSISTEISDLAQIDIGIMPLPNDEWSKGKCGFKALQYMSLGIPTIASAIGVNNLIINHGVNGYLADSPASWKEYIGKLIMDPELRVKMGSRGRERVANQYSVDANEETFLSLFSLSKMKTNANE